MRRCLLFAHLYLLISTCAGFRVLTVANDNETILFELVESTIPFNETSVQLITDPNQMCRRVEELSTNLEDDHWDMVVLLYEGDARLNPCKYRAHKSSIVLLQFFNTSLAPSYLPEIVLYSRFGKMRLGPFAQRNCTVQGPNQMHAFDLPANIRRIMHFVERLLQQSTDEMVDDLAELLKVLSEEQIVEILLREREAAEAKSKGPLTPTTLFMITYTLLSIYLVGLVFVAWPDYRHVLRNHMEVQDMERLLEKTQHSQTEEARPGLPTRLLNMVLE